MGWCRLTVSTFGPSRRLYFLYPNARAFRPDSQGPAFFFGFDAAKEHLLTKQDPELANVINTAQTVTCALV